MQEYKCKCGEKDRSNFYDGVKNSCKTCHKKRTSEYANLPESKKKERRKSKEKLAHELSTRIYSRVTAAAKMFFDEKKLGKKAQNSISSIILNSFPEIYFVEINRLKRLLGEDWLIEFVESQKNMKVDYRSTGCIENLTMSESLILRIWAGYFWSNGLDFKKYVKV